MFCDRANDNHFNPGFGAVLTATGVRHVLSAWLGGIFGPTEKSPEFVASIERPEPFAAGSRGVALFIAADQVSGELIRTTS